MFKLYKDLDDVVSLLIYCPHDKTFLISKEQLGDYWIPSSKTEKHCWKSTAFKIYFEIFGVEPTSPCTPLRINKIWLPLHRLTSVYHAIYKVAMKSDSKKKFKIKQGLRNRLYWLNSIELERQRAHANLKSPELAIFCQIASGEMPKDDPLWQDLDTSLLVETSEDDVVLDKETGGGGASGAHASPNYQLLQSANYSKDDQVRLYCEFMVLSFPGLLMSYQVFAYFMVEMGWQRAQCQNLFRAADVSGRGGLTFQELVLWCAAIEPGTQHGGVSAEIRCRYMFSYFDSNRDLKLEYTEFKELVAATRTVRQLPVDSISVARDADVCLKQLGMQPNSQISLSDFLRCVGQLRLRGTSSMLRSPRCISAYLADIQLADNSVMSAALKLPAKQTTQQTPLRQIADNDQVVLAAGGTAERRYTLGEDYNISTFTVRVHREGGGAANELIELDQFDENAVSPSTARLLAMNVLGAVTSLEVLGPASSPGEAMAAVHYYATPVEKLLSMKKRLSIGTNSSLVTSKAAFSWAAPAEETVMGALLFKLAEAVRPICQAEPRLLRLSSPVYVVGDLHGNLAALLAMETALWPSGAALSPAKLLFLGDFVDRGPHGTEIMAYLLAAKLQRPKGVLLIRGNHETRDIQRMFTFHTECVQKYGDAEGGKIWNAVNNLFDVLPLAAVIDDKVFCCHGGIPPPWVCPLISAIDKVPVPLVRPAEQSTIAWELLWNDPVKPNRLTASAAIELAANEGFAANAQRGTGHVFDQTAIDRFLLANQLSHVVRAHELHQNGFMVQLRGRLISVFSSSHYCGGTNDIGVALLEGSKLRLIRVGMDG